MAGYEKITVKSFVKKLKDGDYVSLTGARRAIGRMTTWSEAEKDKARAAAAKHFGDAPPPKAAKKTSKKKAKKKSMKRSARKKGTAKKRPAKKAAKKVSKKKAAKKKTRSVRASTQSAGSSKKKAKKSSGKRAKGGGRSPSTPQSSVQARLEDANAKTKSIAGVLSEMERTKKLGVPDDEVAADARKAQQGLSRVIDEILALTNQAVSGEPSAEQKQAANDFAAAARAAGANGASGSQPQAEPTATPPATPTQTTTQT